MNPARLVESPGLRTQPLANLVFRGYLIVSPREHEVVAGRIAIPAVEVYADCVAFIWRYDIVNLEEFSRTYVDEIASERGRYRPLPELGSDDRYGPELHAAGLVVRRSMHLRDDVDTVYLSSWENFGGNVRNLVEVDGKRAYRPTVPDAATELELTVMGTTFGTRLD